MKKLLLALLINCGACIAFDDELPFMRSEHSRDNIKILYNQINALAEQKSKLLIGKSLTDLLTSSDPIAQKIAEIDEEIKQKREQIYELNSYLNYRSVYNFD